MSNKCVPPLWTVFLLLVLGLVLATGVSYGQLSLSARAQAPTVAGGAGAGDDGGGDPDNPVPFTGTGGTDSCIQDGKDLESAVFEPALPRSIWGEWKLLWTSVTGTLKPLLNY